MRSAADRRSSGITHHSVGDPEAGQAVVAAERLGDAQAAVLIDHEPLVGVRDEAVARAARADGVEDLAALVEEVPFGKDAFVADDRTGLGPSAPEEELADHRLCLPSRNARARTPAG